MTSQEERTFGVIYPIAKKFVPRILDDGRLVFAKYQPHRIQRTRLGEGSIVVFYQTKGSKKLVGEAIIKSVDFMVPAQALRRFGSQLFLNRPELERYSKKFPGREDKPMMIFQLGSPKRYDEPITWSLSMTMAGRYITKEQYEQSRLHLTRPHRRCSRRDE